MPAKDNDIYQCTKTSDTINFINEDNGQQILAKIKFVHHYPDVASMLEAEGVENVLSSFPKTIESGVKVYHGFFGYQENVIKFGIYALAVEVF